MSIERQQGNENVKQSTAQPSSSMGELNSQITSKGKPEEKALSRYRSWLMTWIHRIEVVVGSLVSLEVVRALVALIVTIIELLIHNEMRSPNEHTNTGEVAPVQIAAAGQGESVAKEAGDFAAVRPAAGNAESNKVTKIDTAELGAETNLRRATPRIRIGSSHDNTQTNEAPAIDFSDETATTCLDKACEAAQQEFFAEARQWLYGAFHCAWTPRAKGILRRRALLRPELKPLYLEIEDGRFDNFPAKRAAKA